MLRNSFIAVIPCVVIGCGDLQPLIEGTGSESGHESGSEPGSESGSDTWQIAGSASGSDTGADMGSEDTTTGELEPACGDGVVDEGEECDEGEANDNMEACKEDCTAQVCGDGHIGPEEDCDDGIPDDNDGCTAECLAEFCGDTIKQTGEECDEGVANDNSGACTEDCKTQICGDGHVGLEEDCDDGNVEDGDGCTAECAVQVCGDGITQPGEECDNGESNDNSAACTDSCNAAACGDGFQQLGEACDDGNMVDLDGCTPQCVVDVRLVFATSIMYTGDLGGVIGADVICNTHALVALLPGTYKAWISTNVNNVPLMPANRFMHSNVPYFLVNDTKVADNWADLTGGALDHAIDLTEHGLPTPQTSLSCTNSTHLARTGTAPDGTLGVDLGRCEDFTQAANNVYGTVGNTNGTGAQWSQCGGMKDCATLMPIYCFQQ